MKRFFKLLFYSIVILLGIGVIIGFIAPENWQAEKKITIKSDSQTIFKEINSFKNWSKWAEWHKKGKVNFKMIYSGADKGVGAKMQWKEKGSEKGGKGEIIESKDNVMMKYKVIMTRGTRLINGQFRLTKQKEHTEVEWRLWGSSGYNPFRRMMMLMFRPRIEKDIDAGLKNLKVLLEKKKK